MLLIGYPKCSTCRKAGAFLEAHQIPHTFRDIKLENPSARELSAWWKASNLPLRKFFNTSGKLYQALSCKDRLPNMTEEEQLELLATDGMLVKRPILVGPDLVLVGFREKEWEKALLP